MLLPVPAKSLQIPQFNYNGTLQIEKRVKMYEYLEYL
jgi:hypothetical protein